MEYCRASEMGQEPLLFSKQPICFRCTHIWFLLATLRADCIQTRQHSIKQKTLFKPASVRTVILVIFTIDYD